MTTKIHIKIYFKKWLGAREVAHVNSASRRIRAGVPGTQGDSSHLGAQHRQGSTGRWSQTHVWIVLTSQAGQSIRPRFTERPISKKKTKNQGVGVTGEDI